MDAHPSCVRAQQQCLRQAGPLKRRGGCFRRAAVPLAALPAARLGARLASLGPDFLPAGGLFPPPPAPASWIRAGLCSPAHSPEAAGRRGRRNPPPGRPRCERPTDRCRHGAARVSRVIFSRFAALRVLQPARSATDRLSFQPREARRTHRRIDTPVRRPGRDVGQMQKGEKGIATTRRVLRTVPNEYPPTPREPADERGLRRQGPAKASLHQTSRVLHVPASKRKQPRQTKTTAPSGKCNRDPRESKAIVAPRQRPGIVPGRPAIAIAPSSTPPRPGAEEGASKDQSRP